jgi:hypothetical protein
MAEKRTCGRRRVLKGAFIVFNERRLTLPCTVRDISETGARLQVPGSVVVPDKLTLVIEIDGFEVDCEVARRRPPEVGVRFVSAPRQGTPKRAQVVKALVAEPPPSLRRKPK